MRRLRATPYTLTAAAAVLLLVALSATGSTASEGQRFNGFPDWSARSTVGTWFMTTPTGLSGLYTFHPDGTWTGVVSNMAGGPPQSGAVLTDGSPDHGAWRRGPDGVEGAFYRFRFDRLTGDPTTVVRVRTVSRMDPGGASQSGTFIADVWNCPTALTCPDPNTTPPDIPNISPPPPANEFTLTRVRFP